MFMNTHNNHSPALSTYSSSSSEDEDLDDRSLFSLDLSSSSSSSSSEYTSLVFNGCFFASNSAGEGRRENKEKQAVIFFFDESFLLEMKPH